MSDVEIEGAERAFERVASFPGRLAARLEAVMRTVGGTLEDSVRANLGGRVLRARSGRLRASLALGVASHGDDLVATLGIDGDVPYAAYQEYGFHGIETVRAHLRTIKRAFGRPIAARHSAVNAHSRRIDYPAHSYMRSALDEIGPDFQAQIETAVAEESDA